MRRSLSIFIFIIALCLVALCFLSNFFIDDLPTRLIFNVICIATAAGLMIICLIRDRRRQLKI